MRHFVYTLGIYFFSQGLYARDNRKFDTSFVLFTPKPIPENPWISAALGLPSASPKALRPTIFCNFRNLPLSNHPVGNLVVHSTWRINNPYSLKKESSSQTSTAFTPSKSRYTHHRITYLLDLIQQEHGLDIEIPISSNTSIITGIGILHTNQYALQKNANNNANFNPTNSNQLNRNNHQTLLGRIQWVKTISKQWTFLVNANCIVPTTGNYLSTKDIENTLVYEYPFHSVFSTIENPGISWYYPTTWLWNLESAVILTGTNSKIPGLFRTKIGNRGSSYGLSTWLPIQFSGIDFIEINVMSGETPLMIYAVGRTISSNKHTKRIFINWKAGIEWHNHLGIIPHCSLLLKSH